MVEFLTTLVSAERFIPHGHCYLWKPGLVWLHVLSDALIALAYYSIPFLLLYFVRKRRDIPFDWIFLMFGSFIVACGTTHLLEVWTLWHPIYWLSGFIKALTALISLCTAVLLVSVIPKALTLPSPAQLETTNLALRNEIAQRKLTEEALQIREQEFQAIVENTPDVITRYDHQLRHLYINPAIEKETQIPPQKFIGKTLSELAFPEEYVLFWESNFQRVFVTGETSWMEFDYPSLNGKEFYQARLVPEFAVDGSVESLLSIARNITQLKLAEEALKQANEQLERRVLERTAELALINESLQAEIETRKRVEEELRKSLKELSDIKFALDQSVILVITDAKGVITYVNNKFCEISQYSQVELIGKTHKIINSGYHTKAFFNNLWLTISNGQIWQGEIKNRAKDGTDYWVDTAIIPFLDDQGKPLQYLAIRFDITERKQAQEELEKNYNLFHSVIEGTDDAIVVKDFQGRYLMINSAVTTIQGKPKSEIIGRDDSELFGHEAALPIIENDRRIMTTGKTEFVEEELIIDGTLRTYLSTKSVWRNAQGSVIGLILIAREITQRKRAEQEIRELNFHLERRVAERTAELEVANQELVAFSYSISHDLRAPLRGIDGFSQALLDRYADKLDDKGKHYLQRIRSGTQRMGELIDDLLKLSRVTRSEMHRTKVDLSALAREIARELYSTQPERQVDWAISPGLVAQGDARLLRVALENLLNNAWKFTSSRIHSRIEFNVILEGNQLTYFVRDNGVGFDMAYANKLFAPFQRLHQATQFPGTGIGLATVQRIIHRHGGRVWAEGLVEQGATFYFAL